MNKINIRNVLPKDLDECYLVETSGFPPEEAATRETIRLRIETFPQGFLVAEINGRVVGILNSAATDKDDISDEELKQLIGHHPHGKNLIVFALAVLPEFQKRGIASKLMSRFIEGRSTPAEKGKYTPNVQATFDRLLRTDGLHPCGLIQIDARRGRMA